MRRYTRAIKEYDTRHILTKNEIVSGLQKMDFLNVFSKEEEKKEVSIFLFYFISILTQLG
jgi:hypothetical protein